jgi:hypothetical protein
MSAPEIPFVDINCLLELVGELHAVLELVDVELDAIACTPQPMPSELEEALTEHEALLAALRAAPEEWKPRLRELYQEAYEDAYKGHDDLPAYPVDKYVVTRLAEVFELVRRRALLDVHLADALREMP